MAEFQLESDESEPLWQRGDETITIGGSKFDVLDRANPIRENEEFNPESRPVTYTIESLVTQVFEDQRNKLRKALVKGVDDGTIRVRQIMQAIRWIGERREEAEERAVAKQTGRPTSAQ